MNCKSKEFLIKLNELIKEYNVEIFVSEFNIISFDINDEIVPVDTFIKTTNLKTLL